MATIRRSAALIPFLRLAFRNLIWAVVLDLLLVVLAIVAHSIWPSQDTYLLAVLAGMSLGFLSLAALVLGTTYALKAFPAFRRPVIFLILVTSATLVAHLYIINNPGLPDCRDVSKDLNGCIMDEVYYVPTAENMLNGTQCGPTVPNCNLEHPFLSKALIASGIVAFGDNAFGWRIFEVLMGTFSLPLLFALALKLSRDRRVAYLSSTLLGLDVMFFSHSSAALIDVHMVFFALLAFVIYFYEIRIWRVDKFLLAGVVLGLAGLSKETAIFLAATLVTYHLLVSEGRSVTRVAESLRIVVATGLVFILGLQAYDSLFASGAFPSFLNQIQYMVSYGSSLIGPGWTYGSGVQITPLSWMTYYQPVTYYGTSVSVCTNLVNGTCLGPPYTYVGIAYYGFTNLLETWTTYVWLALAALVAWRMFKPRPGSLDEFGFVNPSKTTLTGDQKVAVFSLLWFSWNYFPYLALFLVGRVTYPFYFIPALPAVALGAGFLLTRNWLPRYTPILYVGCAFVFFFVFFPEKAFLPEWLRVAIGR